LTSPALPFTLASLFYSSPPHSDLHSFPTRRSSDLMARHFGMALAPWDVLGAGRFFPKKALEERKSRGEGIRTFMKPVLEQTPERSEEHTSELQSRFDLVCRLLLEKKNKKRRTKSEY